MDDRINPESLEQTADVFYSRIAPIEREFVRATVDNIGGYLLQHGNVPFLIAGVGSILRNVNPALAKDIDLAVVGFSYAPQHQHSFDDVIAFTHVVRSYFSHLAASLDESHEIGDGGSGMRPFSSGSGPFEGCNEGIGGTVGGVDVRVVSELESFGPYDSKGLQVKYKDSRPIDIQFVFNKTVKGWIADQNRGYDREFSRERNDPRCLYSLLLQARQEGAIEMPHPR